MDSGSISAIISAVAGLAGVTTGAFLALEAGTDASYLLCGPDRFLAELSAGLEVGGASPDRIDFEMFGPSE